MDEPNAPLLDEVGAADYLNTSARHVRYLRYQGRLGCVRVGRLIRFRRADLDDFIARNTSRATS